MSKPPEPFETDFVLLRDSEMGRIPEEQATASVSKVAASLIAYCRMKKPTSP